MNAPTMIGVFRGQILSLTSESIVRVDHQVSEKSLTDSLYKLDFKGYLVKMTLSTSFAIFMS